MRKQIYTGLASFMAIGALLMAMTANVIADPVASMETFQMTGKVEFINTTAGRIVINDREYMLPSNSASAKTAIRGARVDFSYRESKPLPVITEISIRR